MAGLEEVTVSETDARREDVKEDDMTGWGVPSTIQPACSYSRSGVCGVHGPASKKWRPSKVWTKNKHGLFGWKYTRHVY